MKNNRKILLLTPLLFFPVIVFASTNNGSFGIGDALLMETFITIHMSLFVLLPLAKIISKENSSKTFLLLFLIRAMILLYFDFYVTTDIALVDFFAVFIGAFILIPILAIKSKNTNIVPNSPTSNIQTNTTIPGVELRCPKCNGLLDVKDNFCQNCGTKIEGNNIKVVENKLAKIVQLSSFDSIYSLPENQMIDEFINRELQKAGIDKTTKLIPSAILKKKNIINIIFSFLIFIYITMIFFHFPIATYVIGAIILLIVFKTSRNFKLNSYIKKEIQSRPSEKISNIVMNIKNTFVTDNTNKFLILGIIISIILSLTLFKNPRIIYEKTDDGYAVRYYIYGLTNNKTAKIPEKHKGKNIVELRGNTFSNMRRLKKVELPDTITSIRGQAFKNCISLEEVNLPKNLKYLGGGAFYNATSIKNIELPDTLVELGGESFYNAKSLESIKLSNSLAEIRGNTFEGCISLKSITIPESVTRIGGHAFYGNTNLEEVIILGDNLEEIGSSAFRRCYNLREISIPQRTYINERAFKESPTEIHRYGENNIYN